MILLLLIVLLAAPVYAAPGIAVVQSAAPTSNGGTQDFTSSGFGTPVCALFFGGYGTANGTAVNHAGLWVGVSDFTTHQSVSTAMEDTGSTTDTGAASGTDALQTLLSSDQTVDGTATASTITNGVRLTWADAPPSAYLITAVLFNADAVSNCVAGSIATSTSIGGTASASGFGWEPDTIIAFGAYSTTHARTAIGLAINDGGIVQYSVGHNSQNGVATADLTEVIRSDRLVLDSSGSGGASHELTSFDSGGFTVTTRDATTARTVRYLAMRRASGVGAKLLTCTSPTSTGAHSCTGAGFRPQAGLMLHTKTIALGTYTTSGTNNQTYGLSAFTAAASSISSFYDQDGTASANTESITDTVPVRLRDGNADFMTATSTGAQADGWNFNYSVTDSTARYRVVLFFQNLDTAAVRRRAILLP